MAQTADARDAIRVRDLDHVVIRARDVAALTAFYCDVLGLAVAKRNEAIGIVHLRAGRSMIDLVPTSGQLDVADPAPPSSPAARNMDHLCLRVEPFDQAAIVAHLAAAKVRVGPIGQRFGAEGDGPSIYLYDPEDNVVELKGPSTPP